MNRKSKKLIEWSRFKRPAIGLSCRKLFEKKVNFNYEMLALAQFKEIDVDEIEETRSDHLYETDGEKYWVSDYDTAYEEAVVECENLFDDIGLEAVTEETQEFFIENERFCYFNWEEDMHESNRMYAQDIATEDDDEYGTRLVRECAEAGLIDYDEDEEYDEGDLVEQLADSMDDGYDSMSEYYESIYGSNWTEEMRDVLKDNMNYRECAEHCVDVDGIAHTLARYDDDEHVETVNGEDYYIYRIN